MYNIEYDYQKTGGIMFMPKGIYPKEKRRKFLSESHKLKIGKANSISRKGKKHSEETKKKIALNGFH